MNTVTKIELNSSDEAHRASQGKWQNVEVYQAQRFSGTPQEEERRARRVMDENGLMGTPIPSYRMSIEWRTVDRMVTEAKATK